MPQLHFTSQGRTLVDFRPHADIPLERGLMLVKGTHAAVLAYDTTIPAFSTWFMNEYTELGTARVPLHPWLRSPRHVHKYLQHDCVSDFVASQLTIVLASSPSVDDPSTTALCTVLHSVHAVPELRHCPVIVAFDGPREDLSPERVQAYGQKQAALRALLNSSALFGNVQVVAAPWTSALAPHQPPALCQRGCCPSATNRPR